MVERHLGGKYHEHSLESNMSHRPFYVSRVEKFMESLAWTRL
jgi:hypothetical protein